jgi:hypothetical protein
VNGICIAEHELLSGFVTLKGMNASTVTYIVDVIQPVEMMTTYQQYILLLKMIDLIFIKFLRG